MAARSTNLKRDVLNLPSKIFFTVLFFMMGFSIIGAGLKGQESTAPIIMTIGMLMVMIGIAPFYIPVIYSKYVDPKIPETNEKYPDTAL